MYKSNNRGKRKSAGIILNRNRLIFVTSLLIVLLAGMIFSSSSAYALGITPGERAFVYDGQTIEYNIKIINDEAKSVTYGVEVNGELAKYVSLRKSSIDFSPQKTDELISVKLSIPASEKIAPGEYTIRLIVKGEESGASGVVAFVGVISKLTISIPGNDAYVKANLMIPNFVKGQDNSFSVEIINKGVKPAENCFAVVDVTTSLNSKIVSLISNKVTVQGTRSEKMYMSWTPNVNNGNYLAKASVICDGTASDDQKTFTIGSPEINVVGFNSDSFTLGSINKFDMILGSEWGEQIENVYADVDLAKDGTSLVRTKTELTDLPALGKSSLPVYLDTKGMAPGKYSLYIMLHYLDKDVGEVYNMQMSADKVSVDKLSGMVSGGDASKNDNSGSGGTNSLLIIVIIIIVILNVVLVLKLIKNKNKS
jgi:hypothetical protein